MKTALSSKPTSERLTETSWRNLDPWECCGQNYSCKRGCHEKGGCLQGCIVPKIYYRLAVYEDTGLEPEEISSAREAIKAALALVCELQAYGNLGSFDHLRDLVNAERDGRLVVLPCKVGDTVWITSYNRIDEATVTMIRPFVLANGVEFRGNAEITIEDPFYRDGRLLKQDVFIVFGKDAFLTSEEAEAALEALKGGDENG